MNLDGTESVFLIVVFLLFGVQTIAAGVGWCFKHWRDFQDLVDDRNEDVPIEKKVP